MKQRDWRFRKAAILRMGAEVAMSGHDPVLVGAYIRAAVAFEDTMNDATLSPTYELTVDGCEGVERGNLQALLDSRPERVARIDVLGAGSFSRPIFVWDPKVGAWEIVGGGAL